MKNNVFQQSHGVKTFTYKASYQYHIYNNTYTPKKMLFVATSVCFVVYIVRIFQYTLVSMSLLYIYGKQKTKQLIISFMYQNVYLFPQKIISKYWLSCRLFFMANSKTIFSNNFIAAFNLSKTQFFIARCDLNDIYTKVNAVNIYEIS